jgi:hypothetical protein
MASWRDIDNTWVAATSLYEDGEVEQLSYSNKSDGSYTYFFDTTLGVGMQSAIYYGMGKNKTDIQRQTGYSCPGSTCEFSMYKSLGVCSECNDVPTSSIVRVDGDANGLLEAYVGGWDVNIRKQNATAFQLPNGQFIVNPNGMIDYGKYSASTTVLNVDPLMMTAKATANRNKTLTLQHRQNLIWAVSIFYIELGTNGTGIWPNIPMTAKECGVYWCVNQYDSRIEKNTLSEVVTEVSALWKKSDWDNLGEWKDDDLEFQAETSKHVPGMFSLCVPGEQQCFQAGGDTVWALNNHFKKTFLNNVTLQDSSVGLGPDQLQNQARQLGNTFEPYNFKNLWNQNKNDLQDTFQNMAYSMTNEVRGYGEEIGSDSMSFSAQNPKIATIVTVFDMQWLYIILHCLTIVLSAIFIQLTARNSVMGGVPAYKSSAVAVLGCKSNVAEIMEGAETLRQIEKRSTNNKVHLMLAAESNKLPLVIRPPDNLPTEEEEE